MKNFLIAISVLMFINSIIPDTMLDLLDVRPYRPSSGHGGTAILAMIGFFITLLHILAALFLTIFSSHFTFNIGSSLRGVIISNCLLNFIWLIYYQIFLPLHGVPAKYTPMGYTIISCYFLFDFFVSFRAFSRHDDE